ncbi:MAG TPA: universal stress protein [Flavisolibacter sp.]
MKTLIVATDFSSPAENAMLFAGSIASKIQARVMLFHVYQIPVSMAEVPVLMISGEELKHAADEGLKSAAAVLQNAYPSLNIITESRLGDVNDELNEVCKTMDPFAIVTGKHGASGLERFLFGSTSLSIVRHTSIPVIVIPDTSVKKEISNVALAIDDLKEELPQQQKIKTFIETLGAQLHIIHVQGNKTSSKELDKLVSFLHSKCETIHSDEFFTGIQSYLNNKNIDMLITIPHKHSFVERLTFRTHTEELLKKLTIPIACISED